MERLTSFLAESRRTSNLRRLIPVNRLAGGRIKIAGDLENGRGLLDFSSNDYLGLANHPEMIAGTAEYLERFGTGAGASRLMSGDLEIFHRLENEITLLKKTEAALLFGSGYLANISVIPALAGKDDAILTDRLDHASIYDGCRLSGAGIIRFRHNDLNHLEELLTKARARYRRALIVVESIYSMDGDRCPLPDLVDLKNRFSCLLMVDEAHATGIFGDNGGGVTVEDGVTDEVDIVMGTFSKALGSYGAYVAAGREMVEYLLNRARGFIYSTALPPAVAGASLSAVALIRRHPEMRNELFKKCRLFKDRLRRGGLGPDFGPSQIVPVIVGKSAAALETAAGLKENGIFVTPVRPPTVPRGTARLRFSITLSHSDADLATTAEILLDVLGRGLVPKG